MKTVIIAYPIKETAMQLRNVLESDGIHVSYVCATGASVLGIAADMRGGVIVCASILRDMGAGILADRLPSGFDVVALCKSGSENYMGNLISLPLPLDRSEFLRTVEVLLTSETSLTNRDRDDYDCISNAKAILMSTDNMSEMQAHKYLQRESMRRGKKINELAKEIISNFEQ